MYSVLYMVNNSFFKMCTIDMAVGALDKATVKLIPDQLNMEQEIDICPSFT